MDDKKKLYMWQERHRDSRNEYTEELNSFIKREKYYSGSKDIYGPDGRKSEKKAANIRNICFELIESQIESTYPTPKVTPYQKKDEDLAKNIEDMLRNEMDRLPSEYLNDMDERTTLIQGGDFYLVEWDSSKRTHTTIGELAVQLVHPRKVIPQKGAESLEKSDWVFVELAQTKEYIKRRYKKDVSDEDESTPEIRGEDKKKAPDLVTQVIVYYRNKDGGVGLFSWVNDVVLEDLEDYQARTQKYCPKCDLSLSSAYDSCPYCGYKKLQDRNADYYELEEDIVLLDANGVPYKTIPAYSPVLDEAGNPMQQVEIGPDGVPYMGEPIMQKTKIPYYKPNIFPLIVRKNVSVDGKILGNSDIDFIADQQNEINQYLTKISEKTKMGGSLVLLPESLPISNTDEEMKLVRYRNPEEAKNISVYNLQADFSGDIQMAENNYQFARQEIGITESFQGRMDKTATSGKAKEFSANQTAGRFESKKAMKRAAYADLYRVMFMFMLAYSDEPRNFRSVDNFGNDVYKTFNKYDFLEQDDAGEWYWNDRFMFSTDNTGALAQNREALWQETRSNFEAGAFGDPRDINVLIMYWTMMKEMHYPIAAHVLKTLSEQKQRQEQQMMMQQQMQQQMMQQQMMQQRPPNVMGINQ